jgi:hypothetical protein
MASILQVWVRPGPAGGSGGVGGDRRQHVGGGRPALVRTRRTLGFAGHVRRDGGRPGFPQDGRIASLLLDLPSFFEMAGGKVAGLAQGFAHTGDSGVHRGFGGDPREAGDGVLDDGGRLVEAMLEAAGDGCGLQGGVLGRRERIRESRLIGR